MRDAQRGRGLGRECVCLESMVRPKLPDTLEMVTYQARMSCPGQGYTPYGSSRISSSDRGSRNGCLLRVHRQVHRGSRDDAECGNRCQIYGLVVSGEHGETVLTIGPNSLWYTVKIFPFSFARAISLSASMLVVTKGFSTTTGIYH